MIGAWGSGASVDAPDPEVVLSQYVAAMHEVQTKLRVPSWVPGLAPDASALAPAHFCRSGGVAAGVPA